MVEQILEQSDFTGGTVTIQLPEGTRIVQIYDKDRIISSTKDLYSLDIDNNQLTLQEINFDPDKFPYYIISVSGDDISNVESSLLFRQPVYTSLIDGSYNVAIGKRKAESKCVTVDNLKNWFTGDLNYLSADPNEWSFNAQQGRTALGIYSKEQIDALCAGKLGIPYNDKNAYSGEMTVPWNYSSNTKLGVSLKQLGSVMHVTATLYNLSYSGYTHQIAIKVSDFTSTFGNNFAAPLDVPLFMQPCSQREIDMSNPNKLPYPYVIITPQNRSIVLGRNTFDANSIYLLCFAATSTGSGIPSMNVNGNILYRSKYLSLSDAQL